MLLELYKARLLIFYSKAHLFDIESTSLLNIGYM